MHARLSLTQHLGLYSSFHQDSKNRGIHALCTPMVLFTGMMLLAYVAPTSGSLFHAGTFGTLVLMLAFLQLDVELALLLGAALLIMAAAASALVSTVPAMVLVPTALVLHAMSWFGVVVIGHTRYEPKLVTARGDVDSNEYFRRRLFLAKNVGVDTSWVDSFLQFSISPLAEVVELLQALGLRPALHGAVAVERARIVRNLAEGRTLIMPSSQRALPIVSECENCG